MGYLMKKVKRDPANRNLRLLLGIGGASDSNYWTMATERWSIGSLVKNIVDTSISLGFDGVDIDWECELVGRLKATNKSDDRFIAQTRPLNEAASLCPMHSLGSPTEKAETASTSLASTAGAVSTEPSTST
jgi:GH18 family chitinase